jgi:hypothetical protein
MSEPTQLERLAKPFPAKYVKPPAKGKYGDYIDHEIVNQALLIILGAFSFEVQQVFYNPDGLLDGCTASLTAVIDGREVTVTEAGDCEHAENKKTQGDRLKNSASDALKRCAMRLGCGIHVWAGGDDFFLYDRLKARREISESAGDHAQAASAVDSEAKNAGGEDAGSSAFSSDTGRVGSPSASGPELIPGPLQASSGPELSPDVTRPPSGTAGSSSMAPTRDDDPAPSEALADLGSREPSDWKVPVAQLQTLQSLKKELEAEGVAVVKAAASENLPFLNAKLSPLDWERWKTLLGNLAAEREQVAS